jgi:transposase
MIITLMHWPPRRRSNCTGSRTAPPAFLSDSQWLLIADVLADPPPSPRGGRPRVPPRPCLEGILWVLTSGARWQDLLTQYPSPCTCWRRLRDWTDEGRFLKAWSRLLGKLDRFRSINWEEAIGDGSFARAPFFIATGQGAPRLATAARAKGQPSC